jgi:hypothetical protein
MHWNVTDYMLSITGFLYDTWLYARLLIWLDRSFNLLIATVHLDDSLKQPTTVFYLVLFVVLARKLPKLYDFWGSKKKRSKSFFANEVETSKADTSCLRMNYEALKVCCLGVDQIKNSKLFNVENSCRVNIILAYLWFIYRPDLTFICATANWFVRRFVSTVIYGGLQRIST